MAKEERQPIDLINFALLAFLSEDDKTAKGLRDHLEQSMQVELSKTPFFRRMRGLIESGFVEEEKIDVYGTTVYALTDKGKKFCLSWAGALQILVGLVFYTLDYTRTEEYENETK